MFGKLLVLLYLALRTGDIPSVSHLPKLLSHQLQQQRLYTPVSDSDTLASASDESKHALPQEHHPSSSVTNKHISLIPPISSASSSSGSSSKATGSKSSTPEASKGIKKDNKTVETIPASDSQSGGKKKAKGKASQKLQARKKLKGQMAQALVHQQHVSIQQTPHWKLK